MGKQLTTELQRYVFSAENATLAGAFWAEGVEVSIKVLSLYRYYFSNVFNYSPTMKNIHQWTALVVLCLLTVSHTFAQTKPAPAGRTAPEKEAAMQEKMKAAGMQKTMTTGDPARAQIAARAAQQNAYNATDIQLTAKEKKFTVNAFKVDMLSAMTVDMPVASIILYTENQEKIGKINFYAPMARALKEMRTLDANNQVNLAYDVAMLQTMQQFINGTPRLYVVTNSETGSSYLTSDMLPTKMR